MIITLSKGETLTVEVEGEQIEITYGEHELTIHTSAPDSNGREGIIYQETFDSPRFTVEEVPDDPGYFDVIDNVNDAWMSNHSSKAEAQGEADRLNAKDKEEEDKEEQESEEDGDIE